MKLERVYQTGQPNAVGSSTSKSHMALCLRMTEVTLLALKALEAENTSAEVAELVDHIETWRHDVCEDQHAPDGSGQLRDANDLYAPLSPTQPQPSEYPCRNDEISNQVLVLKSLFDHTIGSSRASVAFEAASEMVEYAGYALAQDHGSRHVIPTFLLAQSLMERARSFAPDGENRK
ncbi:MAG: hypothetical protein ACRBB0_18725 [Pelagimonas sp.]|uniref:hypothetical protein n=1 Tax=Pelagimonas sp. TaxID=2073170 RepID=UPI003D6B7E3E